MDLNAGDLHPKGGRLRQELDGPTFWQRNLLKNWGNRLHNWANSIHNWATRFDSRIQSSVDLNAGDVHPRGDRVRQEFDGPAVPRRGGPVTRRARQGVCVCVRERGRESLCVRERESAKESVRESESEKERVCLGERERESVCVCV